MAVYTKINFNHRKEIADYGDLVEMLFPGNRNQQHAAACIFFELKWADCLLPTLNNLEDQYQISRRILQRTRSKLSKLGIIEHVSRFNMRYNGLAGWKLSSRFERGLNRLAEHTSNFRNCKIRTKEKDQLIISLADARRSSGQEKYSWFRNNYRG